MLKKNSINNCFDNINNLISSKFINDIDLESNNITNINYFKDKGYLFEKYMFINLIIPQKINNILKNNINFNDGYFIKKIIFLNKFYINNPNNDFFLKTIKLNTTKDITVNKICDINISNLITNKYNEYFFILEFISIFYYYISTNSYINNY